LEWRLLDILRNKGLVHGPLYFTVGLEAFRNFEKKEACALPTAIYKWIESFQKCREIRGLCMAHCNLQLAWKFCDILRNKRLVHGQM